MKQSNKIFFGLVGLIFIYMTAAFIEVRLSGESRDLDEGDVKIENIRLDNITSLDISGVGRSVRIGSSAEPQIEIKSRTGDLADSLRYTIQGEKLELTGFDVANNTNYELTVYLPSNSPKSFTFKQSLIIMNDVNIPYASITQEGGRLLMQENVSIDSINLVARQDAILNAWGLEVESISFDMDSSDVNIRSQVKRLGGKLNNKSRLVLSGPGDINIQKDETSIIIWNR